MNLDDAIRASAVEVAVRPAGKDDPLNTPIAACRQLTGWIEHRDPVFTVYVHSIGNKPVSPAFARSLDDWEPFDQLEVVDMLAKLDADYPAEALRRAIDRRLESKFQVESPRLARTLLANFWATWNHHRAKS